MKSTASIFALLLLLSFQPAHAQLFGGGVISIPKAETIARGQITHQAITGTQMAHGKKLAGDMTAVSGQIKGVMDQTQQLHEQWYQSLLQVSAGVRNYRQVKEISGHLTAMLGEYSSALTNLRQLGLSAAQVSSAQPVYQQILQENTGLLKELMGVLSANQAKMTDPERLEFIDKIAREVAGQHSLMAYYTAKCETIARLQTQSLHDRAAAQALTGVQ